MGERELLVRCELRGRLEQRGRLLGPHLRPRGQGRSGEARRSQKEPEGRRRVHKGSEGLTCGLRERMMSRAWAEVRVARAVSSIWFGLAETRARLVWFGLVWLGGRLERA